MSVIGLFGDEYDECIGLLKARIEDLGHRARIINMRRFPLVALATVDSGRIICDGYNLLEMDAFFLRELGGRDPFFHVQYTRELWGSLRERYLQFAGRDGENASFSRAVVEIVALRRPVINPPSVYAYRRAMLHELDVLSRRGFSIPPHAASTLERAVAGKTGPDGDRMSGEELILLDFDEETTWDVTTFPKGAEESLKIHMARIAGDAYTVMVVGERILDCAFARGAEETAYRQVGRVQLPAGIERTALEAAAALGARFAEVELRHAKSDGRVWLVKVDTSPYFADWEGSLGAAIAAPLAGYLVEVAR